MITYTNPKALDSLDEFKPYTDTLHVCATQNMREGVYERYQKNGETPFITAPVVSAVSFMDCLLGNWSSQETKLKQYLHLSDIIQNRMKMEASYLASFRRNQIEVLETIRTLEVCGVTPEDLKDLEISPKEKNFHEIWEKLESNNSIKQLRGLLQSGMKRRLENRWISISEKLLKDAYDEKDEVLLKLNHGFTYETIVLHGFYFLTPQQQRIFQVLKESGINIVFLNLYDSRYPETFSFINQFINERHGWIDKKYWSVAGWTDKEVGLADKFLADFEGIQIEIYKKPKHLRIKDFHDFYAFLNEYEKNFEIDGKKESLRKTYLAPNAAVLNDRLQEYYPDLFKAKRHFLGYPIGQFLYQLHQMWDEAEHSLTLSENALFECFASGWLYDKKTKKNARDYTKLLQDVLPFFRGCVTQDSWIERSEDLVRIMDEILPAFEGQDDDRFQRQMASPFSMFSHFGASKSDVIQFIAFLKMIVNIANDLFGDGTKKISLSHHFSKLRKLVEASNPYLEKEIHKEEKLLIDELKQTLQTTPELDTFEVNDISTAVSLYLSGHLKSENVKDELIRPFIEIDGEVFKDNGITHVTGLDENSLPYSEFNLPWPLSEQAFKDLGSRNIPLSFQLLRNDHVKEITRYLLYNLLQFTESIELSWMVQYEDKHNLDKAIYLNQLGLEPDAHDEIVSDNLLDIKLVRTVTKEELDTFLAFPVDALAEFKFCPRRFYYSYLASDKENYQSDFIHEFLFGHLLKAVGALLPSLSDERIKDEVSKLFPSWSEFKKDLIGDENLKFKSWAKKNYGDYTPYGQEEKFSDLRKLFLFPVLKNNKADDESKDVAYAIEKLYKSPETILPTLREEFENQLEEHPVQMEAKPSGKCRYCPHNEFCPDAFHPVDDSERKRTK
jgi:hypothetical protein